MFPFDDVIMFTDEVYKNRIKDSDTYPHISNIRRTLVGNGIVDHSDEVVGAAPTTSPFSN